MFERSRPSTRRTPTSPQGCSPDWAPGMRCPTPPMLEEDVHGWTRASSKLGRAVVRASDFDYVLPPDRVALHPSPERDRSRLMVLGRDSGAVEHRVFKDLPGLLKAGDLVVMNDSKVIPARLDCRKVDSGGRVELLLVEPAGQGQGEPSEGAASWWAMARSSRGVKPGQVLELQADPSERLQVEAVDQKMVQVRGERDLLQVARAHGQVPLPPYVDREAEPEDLQRYQTVYAREWGSVAAPTAGLHFTPELFERLEAAGVGRAFVTLHVGPGTFVPVQSDDVSEHRMHAERFVLSQATIDAIEGTRSSGGRIVAVGTTVVRVLESFPDRLRAGPGSTDLFIKPGHRFRWVDGMITNFHLPRSTLLMLVCAFAGKDAVLGAYRSAVQAGYRFYSYGDAMCIR